VKDEQAVAIVATRFIQPDATEADIKEAVRRAADMLELAAEEVRSRREVSRDEPHVVSPGGRKRPSYWKLSG
jgi:hypothetical protein